ncbi:MAG: Flp pilus assembly complex ATPase component TadA [Candidatus Omnitrophica bacterium]|nr:Flp pilus assembly complex ATPase component TadA [Candidatus Omnitrophota bacterium]
MKDEELKQILIESQLLSPQELEKAINETKKLKRPLERIIVDMHLLNKDALYTVIAQKLGVEYMVLTNIVVSEDLLKIYPEDLARNTQSVPLYIKNESLHVAMQDPTNVSYIDQIQLFTGYPLEVYLSAPTDIEETIKKVYYKKEKEGNIFSEVKVEKGKPLSETTSIVKIVDLIISQAVRDRASDIHIEPEENSTRIRFRIDGILHEIPSPPKEWELAIISRVKVLAGMDIAESRQPQDGHFQMHVDNRIIDFRVSTLPTIHGENLVLRLLDTGSVAIGLERLGFTTYEDLRRYEDLISKPYGIILSTGPTGCGKTTTLYSALMRINTPDRNIITLEDPVEYRLGLIRQVQINPKAGITFANGLRAILRQDPDVIMVGEIRDLETARMAVQAALTGHLVFSTLHTNDAVSAVARLVDMGIEPFLVSASLIGVMAQRLVRLVCPHCREPYKPSKVICKKWNIEDKPDLIVYRSRGCEECKGTGYYGRTGIFELMCVDDEIREMIIEGSSTVELRRKISEKGMTLLWEDGKRKVLKGLTTFEEVARVCEDKTELKEEGKKKKEEVSVTFKPYKEIEQREAMSIKSIRVNIKDIEDYKEKIARWLSEKK